MWCAAVAFHGNLAGFRFRRKNYTATGSIRIRVLLESPAANYARVESEDATVRSTGTSILEKRMSEEFDCPTNDHTLVYSWTMHFYLHYVGKENVWSNRDAYNNDTRYFRIV